MLFTPMILVAGATTIVVAAIDKTCEAYGFYGVGTVLKIAIPILAFACGIYFIETNSMLHWIGL